MNSSQRGVAVISESTAQTLWPDRPAIGEALWFPDINVMGREVVGVVEDIQFHTVGEAPALHVFVPWTQMSAPATRSLLVKGTSSTRSGQTLLDRFRGGLGGSSIDALVRDVVRRVEPGTHIDDVAPLDALVARATA